MTGLFDNGLILNDTLFTSFPASLGYSFETVEVDTVNQSVQIPNYNPVYHYIIIFDNSIYNKEIDKGSFIAENIGSYYIIGLNANVKNYGEISA